MTETQLPQEEPKERPLETPKEPAIKKIYNIFGLIQNTLLIVILVFVLIFSLYIFPALLKTQSYNFFSNVNIIVFSNIASLLFLIGFLTFILILINGLVLYVLYLFRRIDKDKKTFGKKFIIRGILGLIITIILWFLMLTIVNVFVADIPDYTEHFWL